MFVKLRELWIEPKKENPKEPQFNVNAYAICLNFEKVCIFNQIDFHDSHQYNDYTIGDEQISIPRSVQVDDVEYDKVTKIWMPIHISDPHAQSNYIVVLETPDEILELLNGKETKVEPEPQPKPKKGRPPGSKNKAKVETKKQPKSESDTATGE